MMTETSLDAKAPRAAHGPLAGLRVVEFAGIGPGPFACMMLADMGADVVRLARPGDSGGGLAAIGRGRRALVLDLKREDGIEDALSLIDRAEVLVEGFRPGVMERLGLGPQVVLARNPRLVYGRMTGWGQDGPLAQAAGHDINYISLAGALAAIGPGGGKPVPPLNLVGDYGGGGLYLVAGLLAGVIEARRSGLGQVVDCAMCDGVASLMSIFTDLAALGRWRDRREANLLDGGAPFYTVYECADGRHVAIGALEPQFYAELRRLVGLDDSVFDARDDQAEWPALRDKMASVFKARTRDEWCRVLEGSDACFAPVLTLTEAPGHPHLAHRGTFLERAGRIEPAPAPRFSRTPSTVTATTETVLAAIRDDWEASEEQDSPSL